MPLTGGLPLSLCLVITPWPLLCDNLVLPLQLTARAQLLIHFTVYSCLGCSHVMSWGTVEHTGRRPWLNIGKMRLSWS